MKGKIQRRNNDKNKVKKKKKEKKSTKQKAKINSQRNILYALILPEKSINNCFFLLIFF